MFVTNNNTRRTKRAKVEGTSVSNVLANTIGSGLPASTTWTHSEGTGNVRFPRQQHAIIGGHDANGLTIIGANSFEYNEPDNPDGRTDVVLGVSGETNGRPKNAALTPDFPISFQGRGVLAFTSPIRVPVVDKDVSVTGGLTVKKTVQADGGIRFDDPGAVLDAYDEIDIATDLVLSDGTDDGTTDAGGTTGHFVVVGSTSLISMKYAWTSIGSIGAGSAVRIQGLPYASSGYHELAVSYYTGITLPTLNGRMFAVYVAPNNYLELLYHDLGDGSVAPITGSMLDASGNIYISGIARI